MSARAAFWRKIITDLAIMSVIGAFLAVIGPFGSISQPLALRLVSWLSFAYLGYAIYAPMGYFVARFQRALALPAAPLWVAAVLIATVPMTIAIVLVQYLPNLPPMPSLEEALTSYFYVLVVGGAVTFLFYTLESRANHGKANGEVEEAHKPASQDKKSETQSQEGSLNGADRDAPAEQAGPANPLFDQLDRALGSDVIALEMEDHYVRVHTALGSGLVLMRMRDAIANLSHIEGHQVHRSWWVARGAIEDVTREGRNVRLVLQSGVQAPVSRAQTGPLKEKGWL